ncbi:MAG: DUF1559 domain-containing protein [Pirellulales bacterium]
MVRRTERGAQWRAPGVRDGFTLVELLVVITIIGMLMAMVFPAIGSVLDAVRKLQCSQQLSGIGTALNLYRNQNNQKWPSVSTERVDGAPGAVASKTPTRRPRRPGTPARRPAPEKTQGGGTGFSWLVQLLPYMDQQPLFRDINTKSNQQRGISAFDPVVSDPEQDNRHLSTYEIKSYQCQGFDGSFASTAPEYKQFTTEAGLATAITNYVAMSSTHLSSIIGSGKDSDGDEESLPANGVITYRKGGGIKRVPDGERTIVAVETREEAYAAWMDGTTAWVVAADPNGPDPQLVAGKIKCESGCRTALNVGEDTEGGTKAYYRQQWSGQKPWRFGPSSLHPGGSVNHLLAGGNVIALLSMGPTSVDPTLYMQLVTRDGEETVELPN